MRVVFGTPTYSETVTVEFHNSMMATTMDLTRRGIESTGVVLPGRCFLDRVRNEIVDIFLNQTDAKELLFIDADVGWDYKAIPRILEYKAGVVAGLVPKRDIRPETIFHQNAITGVINEEKLFQSMEAPTAFMCIKRWVFEKMRDAYPEYKGGRHADGFGWPHTPYFQITESEYGCVGEDIFFCRQLIKLGEFVWIDSDVSFAHTGTKIWRGNFYDHAVATGLLKVIPKES